MNAPVTVSTPIYLDYLSTTPVDPRVVAAMTACMSTEGVYGNAASRSHVFGWKAEEAVENARGQVAELINADPREIVWTSGATESDNLAIKGVAHFYHKKANTLSPRKLSTRRSSTPVVNSRERATRSPILILTSRV
jgi:cysteine desulfurase